MYTCNFTHAQTHHTHANIHICIHTHLHTHIHTHTHVHTHMHTHLLIVLQKQRFLDYLPAIMLHIKQSNTYKLLHAAYSQLYLKPLCVHVQMGCPCLQYCTGELNGMGCALCRCIKIYAFVAVPGRNQTFCCAFRLHYHVWHRTSVKNRAHMYMLCKCGKYS